MPRVMANAEIDGDKYLFGYLISSDSFEVAGEVAQRFLPTLGAIAPKGKIQDALDKEVDIAAVLGSVAGAMDPRAMLALCQKLCSVVTVACKDPKDPSGSLGDSAVFEEHFKGRPGLMLKVAIKSFEVNCGDFFASAANLGGLLKKKMPTTPDPAK